MATNIQSKKHRNHKIVRLVDSFLVKNFGRESNKLPLFINIFIFLLTQNFICNI